MLSQLEQLADEISTLHSRFILVVGNRGSGKTALLRLFAERRKLTILNLGSELGKRLLTPPLFQRGRQAGTELRALIQGQTGNDFLLLDNLEVLFDATLVLNPLDLLRKEARARKIIAVWPGEMRDGRLSHADIGHPEHRSYPSQGLTTLSIQR
ncbi:MAG: BREX-3 system P-loop-containing protein BrxF [Gammaproteobacteria bacterium]